MKKTKGLRLENPAVYHIQVQGLLDPEWSTRLSGLAIQSQAFKSDKMPITTLSGQLRDQAALFGVLNTLYDLRLPLLSVECLDQLNASDE